jgi:hypothetical protein
VTHVVEILHFAGCPNIEKARHAVATGIAQASVTGPVEVRIVEVIDEAEAIRLRFLGSPTVRVDDRDVDASALGRNDFGLQCRAYNSGGRMIGCPPAEWISLALNASRS